MKLEENENSTKVRLMKVKEMVLQDAHHYRYLVMRKGTLVRECLLRASKSFFDTPSNFAETHWRWALG